MSRAVLIDRVTGPDHLSFATPADVAACEAVPIEERLAANSTYDAIRIGALHAPEAPAIQFLPTASPDDMPIIITHAQFLARVTQAANLLHAHGIGKGDVVSFLLPLLPDAFVTLFAAEATGIANPVNPLLEPHQIAEILTAAKTKALVVLGPMPGADIWEKVASVRASVPTLATVFQVGGQPAAADIVSFDEAIQAQPADRLLSERRINPDDIAAYFHTGGTTGTPKLVRHTHRNQVYQAWVCNTMMKAEPGRPLLFGMPLFHVGGSLTQTLTTLAQGGSLVVLSPAGWRNPASVRNLWALVAKYRPVHFSSVPTVLAAALGLPIGDHDVSSLRYSAGGGSAIPVAVGRALQERLGVPTLEVYGMTETSSVHTIAYPDRAIRLGSVGQPVPYSRVRIVKLDADGRYAGDCAIDEIGVVAMAGPGVFGGYLNDRHNQGAFVEPGWVNSGDLGRLDADGYVWIVGRAKDLVIRGGHNIDPQPIEEAFFQHPAVGLAAVIGQPDAYAGELPVAYIQLKPGASVQPGELEDWVRARTPERAAIPVGVHVIDPMPLTGVGKVFKPKLRWDAAERVFRTVLADLAVAGRSIDVTVGAHGTHGSVATIRVGGVMEADRTGTAAEIERRLAPFVLRHQIAWG